jgi:hypothetical protein
MSKPKMDSSVILKIKKLLALAGSPNPNEAAAAMQKAKELMSSYGISDGDIQLSDVNEFEIKCATNAPPQWEINLILIAAKYFNAIVYHHKRASNGKWRSHWVFAGIGSASEIAAYAYTVLLRQIRRDRAEYIRTNLSRCKRPNKTARADMFCMAWGHGLEEKLSFSEDPSTDEILKLYKAENLNGPSKKLKPIKRNRVIRSDDVNAGIQAGKNATLNQAVSSRKVNSLEEFV